MGDIGETVVIEGVAVVEVGHPEACNFGDDELLELGEVLFPIRVGRHVGVGYRHQDHHHLDAHSLEFHDGGPECPGLPFPNGEVVDDLRPNPLELLVELLDALGSIVAGRQQPVWIDLPTWFLFGPLPQTEQRPQRGRIPQRDPVMGQGHQIAETAVHLPHPSGSGCPGRVVPVDGGFQSVAVEIQARHSPHHSRRPDSGNHRLEQPPTHHRSLAGRECRVVGLLHADEAVLDNLHPDGHVGHRGPHEEDVAGNSPLPDQVGRPDAILSQVGVPLAGHFETVLS